MLEYGRPHDAEIDALAAIMAQAFAFPVTDARPWIERTGLENARVVRSAEGVLGGLLVYPMGQWFGGRSVPMAGIAGVATDTAAQGTGTGTRLMRAAVTELAQSGYALACLYPATQPLYRRAGFEQAGERCTIRVPVEHLALGDRTLPLRRATQADRATINALHRRVAARRDGQIDRSPLLWLRLSEPWGGPRPEGYVVERGGKLEGYCFSAKRHKPGGRQELVVADIAAETPQAATRLLTFLGDHRSLADEAIWHGSAADPLLLLVREQRWRTEIEDVWMLRVLDVKRALEARGFPAALSASLHLEIFDEVIPANRGRWVVEVRGGEARVRQGGDGTLKAHVRGLASLYSGHRSAADLALTGLVEGDVAVLDAASALFAGPRPAMSDHF